MTPSRLLLISLVSVAPLLSACSRSSGATPTTPTTPTAPAAPTPTPTPTPAPTFNLAGNWSGTIGDPADPNPDRVTWAASQTGNSATGAAALIMTQPNGSAPNVANGTMTAVLTESQATFTFTLPAGVFVPFGGPAACSVTGTASATPTSTSITTTMTRTFHPSCLGIVGRNATDTVRLSLTKQ